MNNSVTHFTNYSKVEPVLMSVQNVAQKPVTIQLSLSKRSERSETSNCEIRSAELNGTSICLSTTTTFPLTGPIRGITIKIMGDSDLEKTDRFPLSLHSDTKNGGSLQLILLNYARLFLRAYSQKIMARAMEKFTQRSEHRVERLRKPRVRKSKKKGETWRFAKRMLWNQLLEETLRLIA